MGKLRLGEKMSAPFKDARRRCAILKEIQEKKYPFLDSDLIGMLDDLLKKGVIQLLKAKRLEKVWRTADPLSYDGQLPP